MMSTKRSARPFYWGWYGGDRMWPIALALQNSLNSCEVNCAPVSLTIFSGTPCWAHSLRIIVTVCLSGRRAGHWNNVGVLWVGVHDEENVPSQMRTSKVYVNGSQVFVAGGYECSVALRGCFDAAQGLHRRTISSMSWSMPGQYVYLCASDFIRWIPRCPWWRSLRTLVRSAVGITTRSLNRIHPCSTVRDYRRW